jgi:hypothetical protein
MAPLSSACARRNLLSLCSIASRARMSPFCSAKAPDAAPEGPAFAGFIGEGAKLLGGRTVSLGCGIPSALPRPEVPSSLLSSFWKNLPLGQTLLGYHRQPGCGVVKAAGLHGGAGQLDLQRGVAAEVSKLATDDISKVPEVKPVQNAGYAGPQWKTCIECEQSKRVGDFARVKSSEDKRSDACRACLAALRRRRLGRELDHLELTVEEAWKRAKICHWCNERKEARDFYMDSIMKDGLSSPRRDPCRGCQARLNEKKPTRAAVDIPQRCKCCKEVKLACEFYPNKKARNGLLSMCKGCFSLEVASYRKQYSSEYVQRQTKLCIGCGITKQTSEFRGERAHIDGLYCYCKECVLGKQRQWRAREQEKRSIKAHNSFHKSQRLLGDGISPHE